LLFAKVEDVLDFVQRKAECFRMQNKLKPVTIVFSVNAVNAMAFVPAFLTIRAAHSSGSFELKRPLVLRVHLSA